MAFGYHGEVHDRRGETELWLVEIDGDRVHRLDVEGSWTAFID